MAVPPSVSRLGTLLRYYGARAAGEPARWTRPHGHRAGYEGTLRTVRAAELDPCVHRISVMTRNAVLIYDADRGPAATAVPPASRAAEALARERSRVWTMAEAEEFLAHVQRLAAVAAGHDAEIAEVIRLSQPNLPEGARQAAIAMTAGRVAGQRRQAERNPEREAGQ